ncbi:MAG TPA: phosphoglycerate kinase [Dehalococcoidia bacterium]|nr:phosphoglycerate kinase [Dehalococcoidia bacterium]
MAKKGLLDIDAAGKRVLVRVDYNVPLDPGTGEITDDMRLRASLPTLEHLINAGARVILLSHLGRPEGKVVAGLSLKPVARRLSQLLKRPVALAPDCVGPKVKAMVAHLGEGEVLLLENVRFHPEEEKNAPGFAHALARLADIFVNDAFSVCHRAHASTVGIARYLPAVAGFQLEKEIEHLGFLLSTPRRPFAALLGGAKVKDKAGVLSHILGRLDKLLIGGGMAAPFLKAQEIAQKAKEKGIPLLLPVDGLAAAELKDGAPFMTVPIDQVPPGWVMGDIGPRTIELFAKELESCGTVLWNGPVGVFEIGHFSQGTRALAQVLAGLKAVTIAGGGSTAEAIHALGLMDKFTHVSTGGGASLEFLEGNHLPGIAALQDKGR